MRHLLALIVCLLGLTSIGGTLAGLALHNESKLASASTIYNNLRPSENRSNLFGGAQLSNPEQRLVNSVNAYRQDRNLAPLRVNPILMETARGRDHATVRQGHHVNGQWPWDAARSHGYRGYATENLAWGYATPEDAVGQPLGSRGGWQTSPGHAKAMRGNFSEIGVGVSGRTYVAMFGRPSNPNSNGGR